MRDATDQKTNDRRLGFLRLTLVSATTARDATGSAMSCNSAPTGNRKGSGSLSRRDSRNKAIGAMGFGHPRWSRDLCSVNAERAPPSVACRRVFFRGPPRETLAGLTLCGYDQGEKGPVCAGARVRRLNDVGELHTY